MEYYILAWLPAFMNSSINRQIFFDRIKYTRWVESLFNSKRPSRIEDCTNEINETTEKQISSCFSRIYFITRPYYYYSPLHFSASRYSLCLFVLFTPPYTSDLRIRLVACQRKYFWFHCQTYTYCKACSAQPIWSKVNRKERSSWRLNWRMTWRNASRTLEFPRSSSSSSSIFISSGLFHFLKKE
jgi:hypothetical protein